jgi:hypothetical protein
VATALISAIVIEPSVPRLAASLPSSAPVTMPAIMPAMTSK